jgi:hypothetical protein
MLNAIVYDCEIIKAIQSSREPSIPGIAYCGGGGVLANPKVTGTMLTVRKPGEK